MQAIEFAAQIENGRIELPTQLQSWTEAQTVRVIVLLDQVNTPTAIASKQQRPLGLLRGQLNVDFVEDFKMTEEEFLQS
jgi:hypothetical protein